MTDCLRLLLIMMCLSLSALAWQTTKLRREPLRPHTGTAPLTDPADGGTVDSTSPLPPAFAEPQRSSLEVQLSVHPHRGRLILSQIMLAGGADIPACRAFIELDIRGLDGGETVRNLRIRLRARHADGTPAGQINGPGSADDVVFWKSFNDPMVPFRSDARPGKVTVWAEVLGPGDRVLKTSNYHPLEFIVPQLQLSYDEWKPSSGIDTWERRIYVIAETKALGILDLTGTPVRLGLAPVPGMGTVPRASWLSSTRGATVRSARWATGPGADNIPFTAIQYWRETRDGTRQLNTYRVRAVLDRARLFSAPPKNPSASKDASPKDAAP